MTAQSLRGPRVSTGVRDVVLSEDGPADRLPGAGAGGARRGADARRGGGHGQRGLLRGDRRAGPARSVPRLAGRDGRAVVSAALARVVEDEMGPAGRRSSYAHRGRPLRRGRRDARRGSRFRALGVAQWARVIAVVEDRASIGCPRPERLVDRLVELLPGREPDRRQLLRVVAFSFAHPAPPFPPASPSPTPSAAPAGVAATAPAAGRRVASRRRPDRLHDPAVLLRVVAADHLLDVTVRFGRPRLVKERLDAVDYAAADDRPPQVVARLHGAGRKVRKRRRRLRIRSGGEGAR